MKYKVINKYSVAKTIVMIGIILVVAIVILRAGFTTSVNYVVSGKGTDVEPFSVLLMGTDADRSDGASARTDVLMVVTVTPKNVNGNPEINIVSIPRDTLAYDVCGEYFNKINGAYSTGFASGGSEEGSACAVKTVENLLNIPIDYHISTSFEGLISLVDAIGGIEIDVPYSFSEQDSNSNMDAIFLEQGLHTLSGEEALAYARQRYSSSDYERNIRQQQVISAIGMKVLSDPTKYTNELIDVYEKEIITNLDFSQMTKMISTFSGLANDMLANTSSEKALQISIKTSDFEIPIDIGGAVQALTGTNKNLVTKVPYNEVYTQESETLNKAYVQPIYISKKNTSSPSSVEKKADMESIDSTDNADSFAIEISAYTIDSVPLSVPGGWYSYISPSALNYVSNSMRVSLGLEEMDTIFDYSGITSMNGAPNLDMIYYNDSIKYVQQ